MTNTSKTRPAVVVIATSWGRRHGGINSFSTDLCIALAEIADQHRIVCMSLSADDADRADAASAGVTLLTLNLSSDGAGAVDHRWAPQVFGILAAADIVTIDHWVGHDAMTGELAVWCARDSKQGTSTVLMHMSYADYLYAKHPASEGTTIEDRSTKQKSVLQSADFACAVGPLLFERLCEIRGSDASVTQLVPGLAEDVFARPPIARLQAIGFGRFTAADALVKQAPLAAAGFARAFRTGLAYRNPAFRDAQLTLIGVPPEEAKQLRELAEMEAGRVVNIQTIDFLQSRSRLLRLLSEANACLMLSWHEGFGLAAWEAIGAGVPVVVSQNSGVFRMLESLGGAATGCVTSIDVRGRSDGRPQDEDVESVKNALLAITRDISRSLADAESLLNLLRERDFTWEQTARTLAKLIGLPVTQAIVEFGRGASQADTAAVVQRKAEVARRREMSARRIGYQPDSFFKSRQVELNQFARLTATLARIKNISSFTKERHAIEQFRAMVVETFPTESAQIGAWLNSLAIIISSFSELRSDAYAERRKQRDRAVKVERNLARRLSSGALPQQLADIMTSYHEALKRVLGDLSRQAGMGPQIEFTVLNSFLAPDAGHTVVALEVQNASEWPVTDVHVELRVEWNVATIVNAGQRIARMEPGQLFELPFHLLLEQRLRNAKEVTIDVSLQASADGFPNVDLGVAQARLPIRTLQDVVGSAAIPKLFNVGQALRPTESALFQGRDDVLARIKNSIYAGAQREVFFLDGIRRVGKTSVLNFVPLHMPEDVLSIDLKLEALGVAPPLDATDFVRLICEQVDAKLNALGLTAGPVPCDPGAPGLRLLAGYLAGIRKASGKTPLLIFDEFQRLLEAIAATGASAEVILDHLIAALEDGTIYGLFTGSVRFDRLSAIVKHRIFGHLTRLRVSFLDAENVGKVLRAGFGSWVVVTEAAVRRVHELSGGYPWLVQSFGSNLIDLLNDERRTIAMAADVDRVGRDRILVDNSLFEHWSTAIDIKKPASGQIGIFVDHENLVKTLDRITISRQQVRATDRRDWFSRCLTSILSEAERRVGPLHQKVAVAFWNRANEATLTPAYLRQGFDLRQPEDVGKGDAVDFKLADEVRKTMGQATKEGSHLQDAIIVTGDGDLSHLVSGLQNDRVRVHIWAGGQSLNPKLRELVGDDRVVDIGDVCGA